MAEMPFQFGALDAFSKAGISTQMEAQALQRSGGDFIARLLAANEADTASTVSAPTVRGAGLAGAIGAALTNIVDPGAAERFAAAERNVRAQNAQLQAQADLANQQQQGYLQMRKASRDELMAKLTAEMEEVKARAKARLDELGIQRDTAKLEKAAMAQQKQREADAMANSKWYQEHGQNFERLRTMVETGVQGVDAEGNPIPLKLEDRRSLMDALQRMAITAPTLELRENIGRSIKNLDDLLERLSNAPTIGPDATGVTVGSFGQVNRPVSIAEAQAQREAGGVTDKAPGQILGVGRSGILGPLDLDLITGALNETELGGLVSTGLDAPADAGVQNFLGTFNEIYQRRQAEIGQALDQVAPTRKR